MEVPVSVSVAILGAVVVLETAALMWFGRWLFKNWRDVLKYCQPVWAAITGIVLLPVAYGLSVTFFVLEVYRWQR